MHCISFRKVHFNFQKKKEGYFFGLTSLTRIKIDRVKYAYKKSPSSEELVSAGERTRTFTP